VASGGHYHFRARRPVTRIGPADARLNPTESSFVNRLNGSFAKQSACKRPLRYAAVTGASGRD
jgi:hypothetical protein